MSEVCCSSSVQVHAFIFTRAHAVNYRPKLGGTFEQNGYDSFFQACIKLSEVVCEGQLISSHLQVEEGVLSLRIALTLWFT